MHSGFRTQATSPIRLREFSVLVHNARLHERGARRFLALEDVLAGGSDGLQMLLHNILRRLSFLELRCFRHRPSSSRESLPPCNLNPPTLSIPAPLGDEFLPLEGVQGD